MFGVSYSAKAKYQGQAVHYVPRSSLPTDEECEKLFVQLEAMCRRRVATAMRLAYRGGPRFREWAVLRPCDVTFKPRSVKVYWALDVDGSIKATKNEHRRTTIFPRSLAAEMEEAVGAAAFDASATIRQHEERQCGCGLLFSAAKGGPMVYPTFHQWWIKAADAVGWPMIKPLTRSRSYGKDPKKGRGWRWTGQAQWSPYDLRHVAACWTLFDRSSTTPWWPRRWATTTPTTPGRPTPGREATSTTRCPTDRGLVAMGSSFVVRLPW